jgi:hypothetical protein
MTKPALPPLMQAASRSEPILNRLPSAAGNVFLHRESEQLSGSPAFEGEREIATDRMDWNEISEIE